MRCYCCDKRLSDYESTQRHAETNEFLDMCSKCLTGLLIPIRGRHDLSKTEEYEDDLDGDVPLDSFIFEEDTFYDE
jgi:hypothetical protein